MSSPLDRSLEKEDALAEPTMELKMDPQPEGKTPCIEKRRLKSSLTVPEAAQPASGVRNQGSIGDGFLQAWESGTYPGLQVPERGHCIGLTPYRCADDVRLMGGSTC